MQQLRLLIGWFRCTKRIERYTACLLHSQSHSWKVLHFKPREVERPERSDPGLWYIWDGPPDRAVQPLLEVLGVKGRKFIRPPKALDICGCGSHLGHPGQDPGQMNRFLYFREVNLPWFAWEGIVGHDPPKKQGYDWRPGPQPAPSLRSTARRDSTGRNVSAQSLSDRHLSVTSAGPRRTTCRVP